MLRVAGERIWSFDGCYFGYGNGYAYCRPYEETTFTNCEFENGFKIDPRGVCTFSNCKYNNELITADNISNLIVNNINNVIISNTQ